MLISPLNTQLKAFPPFHRYINNALFTVSFIEKVFLIFIFKYVIVSN